MRGMEWVGRKVFERGYWKSGDDRKAELEVLEQNEGVEVSDGTIEDDEDDDNGVKAPKTLSDLERRWIRICRAAITISGCVDGLTWTEGTREWAVEGKLAQKVQQWKEEDRVEKLEEERRRMGRRWTDDAMEIDESEMDDASSSDDDDENDSEEIKALKVGVSIFFSNILANSLYCVGSSSLSQKPSRIIKTVRRRLFPSFPLRQETDRQPPRSRYRPRLYYSGGRHEHPSLIPLDGHLPCGEHEMDCRRPSPRYYGA